MSDGLQLTGKTVLVTGVANKKSVALHIGRGLQEAGALPVYVVRTEERRESVTEVLAKASLTGDIYVCDVRHQDQIEALAAALATDHPRLDGFVHSIAFADYSDGWKPFHESPKKAFLEAVDVSAFSLVNLSNAIKDLFDPDASVVTISISTTTMAAENYGFMEIGRAHV